MTEAEFWRTTPQMFAELRRRVEERTVEQEKREWRRTAHVLSLLAMISTGGRSELDADDFDPYHKEEPVADPKKVIAWVAQLNNLLGGKDERPTEKRMN